MVSKPRIIKVLQTVHLAVFITAITTVLLLHIFPKGLLDFLRLPQLIFAINPLLGYGWPASLHVYQTILILFITLTLIDGLGLFYYSSKAWRMASDISSFLSLLLFWPIALFFVFTLVAAENLNSQFLPTIYIYLIFSAFLFCLDFLTWFVDEQSILKIRRQ